MAATTPPSPPQSASSPARGAKTSARSARPSSRAPLPDKLARLGLVRPIDFVLHLPLRYEDETRITPVSGLRMGLTAQLDLSVQAVEVQFRPRRQLLVRCADESGELTLRFLNFYASQKALFDNAERAGARVRVFGEARMAYVSGARGPSATTGASLFEMVHPRVRLVDDESGGAHAALPQALTPVYPAGEGLTQAVLRKRIEGALQVVVLQEVLPDSLLERLALMPLAEAVQLLHHPPASPHDQPALLDKSHPAWTRIKFEELLAQQLSLRRARERRLQRSAPALRAGLLVAALTRALPFRLTAAQVRVVGEIATDLARKIPMTRLLQGDVGAGKTVVAALAAAQAMDAGYQAALMAPTELLAEQHHRKLAELLEPLGVRVVWLTGSLKAREKRAAQAALASGEAQLAIGTHALFQDAAGFARLGLAIVDEQHRFGVGQRLALRGKGRGDEPGPAGAQPEPHQLMMSATPIPRTLAMSYLADLDVSVIDELPPGRTPVLTKLVDDVRRDEVIGRIHEAARHGRQVYWVCPLIEESETLELQTAVDTHARLSAELVGLNVGLVHGRLPAAEKQSVMDQFARQQVQVLVATTVIEVGVDVPNASLMVIEHAERFGLSQLHQLRGRVGRGAAESVCVLLYSRPLSHAAKERLKIMHETTDGFEIARRDLELRGPGEFLGARQSGAPLLRFADLELDAALVDQARNAASWLSAQAPQAAEAHLERWMGGREEFLKA